MPDSVREQLAAGRGPVGTRADILPSLVVALDLPTAGQALALADDLRGLPLWLKVGLELFTAEGPDLVKRLLAKHFVLFLDLKFYDIPNTTQGAVRSATSLGAHMTTLHLSGGEAMCRAAVAGRSQGLEQRMEGVSLNGRADNGPLLMGVTVLTSDAGREEDIRAMVVERALAAKAWGLDGVVCSGHEASAVKAACGRDFLCLCPGIRFVDFSGRDDQARVCTPGQAARAGADFLVMGRPITKAEHPAAAAMAALEEISQALRDI